MMPPCLRCGQGDRMVSWAFATDFGGRVEVYGCRRCGTAVIACFGDRPVGPPAPGRIEGNGTRSPT